MRSQAVPSPVAKRTQGVGVLTYEEVIREICDLDWINLTQEDLIKIAWVYYYFSVQFRESLASARGLYPEDAQLLELDHGERDTDNLSPWPGVAVAGERMDHDEFMRRTLDLSPIPETQQRALVSIGQSYLTKVLAVDEQTRALALASYEDGGLENVFRAILKAPHWNDPLLQAFKHFLDEHIRFDNDPEHGHGALCRHLIPDERILPLWAEFKQMLLEAVPELARGLIKARQ